MQAGVPTTAIRYLGTIHDFMMLNKRWKIVIVKYQGYNPDKYDNLLTAGVIVVNISFSRRLTLYYQVHSLHSFYNFYFWIIYNHPMVA
jgi:acetyl esterase/lipase